MPLGGGARTPFRDRGSLRSLPHEPGTYPRRAARCVCNARTMVSTRTCLAAAAACAVVGVAACGSGPRSAAPSRAETAKALSGSPPALAALHRQAGQLLFTAPNGFRARLRSLRGHPIVANKWASWCAPCRSEFPYFQRLGVSLGRRVAFIGVDGNDNDGDAKSFLRRYPVPYPSYSAPEGLRAAARRRGTQRARVARAGCPEPLPIARAWGRWRAAGRGRGSAERGPRRARPVPGTAGRGRERGDRQRSRAGADARRARSRA